MSFGLWSHLNQVHTPYTFSPSTFAILPIIADVVGQKEVVSPLFNWFIDHLLLVCRAPILVAESVDRGGRLCGFGYSRGRSASLLLRRPYLVTPPDGMRGRVWVVEGLCACYDRYAAEKPTVDGLKARLVCRWGRWCWWPKGDQDWREDIGLVLVYNRGDSERTG